MSGKSEIGKKAGLVIVSILLSVCMAELTLRLVQPEMPPHYVWQPNLSHTFYPDSATFYGIKGEKTFSINSQGFRGDEFTKTGLNFLCLGGSTTECLYLDDRETWCRLLQDSVKGGFPGSKFQVGNIGKSGCALEDNYIQLKYVVSNFDKIDCVVFMVGLNDLMRRLIVDSLYKNDYRFTASLEDSLVHATLLSNEKETGLRQLRIVQLIRNVFQRANKVEWENVQDDQGEIFKEWRWYRAHASAYRDSLPDMASALDEFELKLQLIYEETQKQGVKLVLVNQATLYKDSMSDYENSLLWMGGIGNFQQVEGCVYYSPKALKRGIELYNERLKVFSAKRGIKFVNLAAHLPRDTSVFYDDCHFNESGARKVAAIISKQMIE